MSFKTYTLGEVASNTSRRFNFKNKEQVCFVNTGDILDGHFLVNEKVSSIGLPGQAKKAIQKGDILYSEIRPGNKRHLLVNTNVDDYVVSTKFMVITCSQDIVIPEYLYLVLTSKECEAEFKIIADSRSGTFPQITFDAVAYYPVELPSLIQQRAVVEFIRSITGKLNLNNLTNQTLEAMAQAIFKSWFVDFDPVKAKMNGEQPQGMDEATASLFPDKLVESELGLIPEGWAIKPIKDLCTKVQNGGTPKRNENSYWDDGTIPWLTSGEVRQSIITAVENRITQLGLDKSSAKWVPELSTLVALYGATAGEVSLTSIPLTTNQAVCALMPKKEHQWYNYLQLKNRVAELAGKAVGSAQQNISKGLVESTEVLSVPDSLLEAFNSQVENLFRLRICNLNENVELSKLRDTLLPKLLSGEIELANTEDMAEVN
ncbi:restriction endonuclease subunit S [Shewanella avicenniae]|uniref:Restriction endonuclease subunit S n=1 Tax=Shewanella avicenniae TaxID=2814294 RepID=A0ABX7QQK3_9GAMM|nr:restriction endonuclease subunit S [Shewanella avicenniae]QSX33752.1 restriction endonuclease subunit S [Shewanella avicenniae]